MLLLRLLVQYGWRWIQVYVLYAITEGRLSCCERNNDMHFHPQQRESGKIDSKTLRNHHLHQITRITWWRWWFLSGINFSSAGDLWTKRPCPPGGRNGPRNCWSGQFLGRRLWPPMQNFPAKGPRTLCATPEWGIQTPRSADTDRMLSHRFKNNLTSTQGIATHIPNPCPQLSYIGSHLCAAPEI